MLYALCELMDTPPIYPPLYAHSFTVSSLLNCKVSESDCCPIVCAISLTTNDYMTRVRSLINIRLCHARWHRTVRPLIRTEQFINTLYLHIFTHFLKAEDYSSMEVQINKINIIQKESVGHPLAMPVAPFVAMGCRESRVESVAVIFLGCLFSCVTSFFVPLSFCFLSRCCRAVHRSGPFLRQNHHW